MYVKSAIKESLMYEYECQKKEQKASNKRDERNSLDIERAEAEQQFWHTTQDNKIPLDIHFAWEGGMISEDDLSNILFLNLTNFDYNINIWTTRPMSILSTMEKMSQSETNPVYRYLSRQYSDYLTIHNANELYDELASSHEDGNYIRSMFFREINGPYKNYAAASDLTRAAIMFVKGGVYMDCDVIALELPSLDNFGEFIIADVGDGRFANAFIASIPKSKTASKLLNLIKETTSKMDSVFELNSWKGKRSNQSEDSPFGRLGGTVQSSGPGLLRRLELQKENKIPQSYFYHRNASYSNGVPRIPAERDINRLFTLGLGKGFDGRGGWSSLKKLRRGSI